MSIRDMLMLGIGDTKDVGGSETTGTVMAKENALIKNTQKVIDHFEGEWLNNFGDGRMGDYVHGITPDKPMVDEYNRRVYYTDSFTVPAGKTMNPASSNGVIIWSRGDIVIDGTIDLTRKRSTGADPADLPQSISIAGTNFALAVGGAESSQYPTGYQNMLFGDTGNIVKQDGGRVIVESDKDEGDFSTLRSKIKSKSVSGGGTSIKKVSNEPRIERDKTEEYFTAAKLVGNSNGLGAGALVLIAAGKISIKGIIDASGDNNIFMADGEAPKYYNRTSSERYSAGCGGEILFTQGGGGAVTLIATEIEKSGSILVSGLPAKTIEAGSDNTETIITPEITIKRYSTTYEQGIFIVSGGKGAPAYTLPASSVGNIKEYIIKRE